jgi:hypothetical protein
MMMVKASFPGKPNVFMKSSMPPIDRALYNGDQAAGVAFPRIV